MPGAGLSSSHALLKYLYHGVNDVELQNAPVELRKVLTYILDGEVAGTALQLLES